MSTEWQAEEAARMDALEVLLIAADEARNKRREETKPAWRGLSLPEYQQYLRRYTNHYA